MEDGNAIRGRVAGVPRGGPVDRIRADAVRRERGLLVDRVDQFRPGEVGSRLLEALHELDAVDPTRQRVLIGRLAPLRHDVHELLQ